MDNKHFQVGKTFEISAFGRKKRILLVLAGIGTPDLPVTKYFFSQLSYHSALTTYPPRRGREVAQLLVSLSVKRAIQVRARLDPLVTER